MKSPPRGSSTLMTSAPWSPRMPAQNGAEMRVATSMTRMPSRGSGIRLGGRGALVALGEHLFHRALLLPLFEGAAGGLGVADELVDHEVVLPRVALAHELEGVVDRVLDGLGRHRRHQRDLAGQLLRCGHQLVG